MRGLRQFGWLVAGLILSLASAGAATFYTLRTTGNATNRLCIVFLAEGYTSSQTNLFLTDCTNALHSFFGGGSYTGEEPFVEYSNYFNAYAVFTNSQVAGSDHYWTTNRPTAFNSSYDAIQDYVITIPSGPTGQGLVDGFITNNSAPWSAARYKLPLMIVNDTSYTTEAGGSGGATAIVGKSSGFNFQGILVHESCHTLAGLGDEYEADPGGIDYSGLPSEPNTTTNTAYNLIPWKAWINTNTTVIPTPNDPTNETLVGLFEGAHYSPTGWYRPKLNCRMRSVTTGVPLCEVCREALVKTFYSKVRGIDSATPTNASLTIPTNSPVTFSVAALQPLSHALAIQWQLNGTDLTAATNSTFIFNPDGVTNGSHALRAIVRDETDWVRNDPANLLASTNTWNVTVSVPRLWIESPVALAGGGFRFTVRGSAVTNFTIKASTNLANWTSLSTNALVAGQFNFTNVSGLPLRFYRAVAPPQ
jgi:hypothetical protein